MTRAQHATLLGVTFIIAAAAGCFVQDRCTGLTVQECNDVRAQEAHDIAEERRQHPVTSQIGDIASSLVGVVFVAALVGAIAFETWRQHRRSRK